VTGERALAGVVLNAAGWRGYIDHEHPLGSTEWWAPPCEWPGANEPWPGGFGMELAEALDCLADDLERVEGSA
jgi:hypothetical protein